MSVKDAVADRFKNLCDQRNIKVNELANISGVTPSTAYSMLDKNRRDVSIVTIKKFCDGLDITLGEFFSTPEFDSLEQEIIRRLSKKGMRPSDVMLMTLDSGGAEIIVKKEAAG